MSDSIRPDLRVFEVFETDTWDERFRREYGIERIYSTWIYDANLDVHIASFTPMRECHYLGTDVETEHGPGSDAEDLAQSEVMGHTSNPPVEYFPIKVDRSSLSLKGMDDLVDEYMRGDIDRAGLMDEVVQRCSENWPQTRQS